MRMKGALAAAGMFILAAIVLQFAEGLPQNLFIVQAKIRAVCWLVLHAAPLAGMVLSFKTHEKKTLRWVMLLFHTVAALQVWA